LRIVLHVLATMLVGGWLAQTCLAEDASHDGADSAVSAKPSDSTRPAGEDAGSATNLDRRGDGRAVTGDRPPKGNEIRKDGNASDKDPGGIDTRVTVQPRRLSRRNSMKDSNRPLIAHHTAPRRLSSHSAPAQITRDALGVPVVRHEDIGGHDGRQENPGLARTPATGPRPPFHAVVNPTAPNRGAINGTGLTRRGFGPAAIGGPARPVAGISGTTIRPKP
jgi:hypothetical protein